MYHFSSAQQLDGDLETFYRGFMSLNTLECEMEAKAYDKDNTVYLEKKVKFILQDNQYSYDMGDMICLANKKYVVMVDKINKRMVVARNNINEVAKMKKKMIDQNDSLTFKSKGQVVYDGITGGIKKYRVLHADENIKQVNIQFYSATGYLKKIELVFDEDSKMGLSSTYTEITRISTHPVITGRTFDESVYVTEEKGIFRPAPEYKSYKLIVVDPTLLNNLNTTKQ